MALGVLDPNSRFEKSLGLLTTRFVNLLQEAEDGILDLKVAADTLNVRQKRRIYDITNVLEGIGLIEKRNKNCIKWKGAVAGENTQEASERLTLLQDELNRLDQHERLLDQHTAWAGQSIRNIMEDESNIQLAYATHEDIAACCPTETVLAVRAPSGTQLEVPRPEVEIGGRRKYQIHLKVCASNHHHEEYLIQHWFYLSYFVDGDRTDWGCAAGRRREGLYCRSGSSTGTI